MSDDKKKAKNDRFRFHDPSGKTDRLKDSKYYEGRKAMFERHGRPLSSDERAAYEKIKSESIRLKGGGKPSNLPKGWEFDKEEGKWGRAPNSWEKVKKIAKKGTKKKIEKKRYGGSVSYGNSPSGGVRGYSKKYPGIGGDYE